MQIVHQFIKAINLKVLEQGDLLPGSRKIAEVLNVHRKTVIAALSELQDQGWIESKANIGTFVKNPIIPAFLPGVKQPTQPPPKAAYQYRKELILDLPVSATPGKYNFTDGTADEQMIDIVELTRYYTGVLKRKKKMPMMPNVMEGDSFFRDQLSIYLNLTRGFHISRKFLLPVTSKEKILSILARLFIHVGDVVLVGTLSYFLPNMIFNQAGAKIKTVPVDKEGIDVDYIEVNFKPGEIRCLYLNSLCYYPTTVRLSDKRKNKLLQLAEAYNFIVIEDDDDFEFSGLKDKTDSLFKRDGGNRVIYMGTIGKFLNSNFQMHFLIAPADILEEAKKYLNVFGKTNFMLEKALGEMIYQGEILRYHRKAQKIINGRKLAFAQLLDTYFKGRVTFEIPESGLAFWVVFQGRISLIELQTEVMNSGLLIPTTCLYQNKEITAMRLGFAHLNQQNMEHAIQIWCQACLKLSLT